jgi:hypothetical protein
MRRWPLLPREMPERSPFEGSLGEGGKRIEQMPEMQVKLFSSCKDLLSKLQKQGNFGQFSHL